MSGGILVTGASGLLGHTFCRRLAGRERVIGVTLSHTLDIPGVTAATVDLTDRGATDELIKRARPSLVLHCAALTDVDQCERDPKLAERLNVDVTANVASAAYAVGATLVHISTDQLWNGSKQFVNESAPLCPLNVYGRSKAKAEAMALEAHPGSLIVRTNFFGPGRPWRKSFSDWILGELDAGRNPPMFADVFFTPIAIGTFAQAVLDLVTLKVSGIVHVAGTQRLSKYAFGCAIAQAFGYPESRITKSGLADANLPASRPLDMSLDVSHAEKLLGRRLSNIEVSIAELRQTSLV
ncbi:MAG: SDR family oxidoreductase [Nitrospiraceae bacterium]